MARRWAVEPAHAEGAEAGRRRDRQALVHVAGQRGGRAAQGDGLLAGGRRGRGRAGAAPSAPRRARPSSTSALRTIPPGPEPRIVAGSMPRSIARRRATGLMRGHSRSPAGGAGAAARGAGAGRGRRAGGASTAGRAGADRDPRPGAGPPLKVSPASTAISARVPAAGAGTSRLTLSVETSTTVCSAVTASPTATRHSTTTPSVTDSMSGSTIVDRLARRGRRGRGRAVAARRGASAARRPARRRRCGAAAVRASAPASSAPTSTASPGWATMRPAGRSRAGHLDVDLVGRDVEQGVPGAHGVALGDPPFDDDAFGDRLAELRQHHLDGL